MPLLRSIRDMLEWDFFCKCNQIFVTRFLLNFIWSLCSYVISNAQCLPNAQRQIPNWSYLYDQLGILQILSAGKCSECRRLYKPLDRIGSFTVSNRLGYRFVPWCMSSTRRPIIHDCKQQMQSLCSYNHSYYHSFSKSHVCEWTTWIFRIILLGVPLKEYTLRNFVWKSIPLKTSCWRIWKGNVDK